MVLVNEQTGEERQVLTNLTSALMFHHEKGNNPLAVGCTIAGSSLHCTLFSVTASDVYLASNKDDQEMLPILKAQTKAIQTLKDNDAFGIGETIIKY